MRQLLFTSLKEKDEPMKLLRTKKEVDDKRVVD